MKKRGTFSAIQRENILARGMNGHEVTAESIAKALCHYKLAMSATMIQTALRCPMWIAREGLTRHHHNRAARKAIARGRKKASKLSTPRPYPRPRKIYSDSCRHCYNTRTITSISGATIPCPQCQPDP